MSMPVRHLPIVQNWDCHTCGNCCREYQVDVTEEVAVLGVVDVRLGVPPGAVRAG